MVTAPLVMPEIITGLSLLFLFISMANLIGWPMSRGATTITIAHITFSMAYVVVVVRSRLAAMDESLEEAAMDLGGRPLAVFFDITVPMLLPALVSGWLLAFTLSLDDLVISSFVSGPGRDDAADADLREGAAGRDAGHQRDHHDHHRDGGRCRGDRGRRSPAGAGRRRRDGCDAAKATKMNETLNGALEQLADRLCAAGRAVSRPGALRAGDPRDLHEVLALRRAPEPDPAARRLFPVRDGGRVRHPRARRRRQRSMRC